MRLSLYCLFSADPDRYLEFCVNVVSGLSGTEISGENRCCGPGMFIPDQNFSFPDLGSRV